MLIDPNHVYLENLIDYKSTNQQPTTIVMFEEMTSKMERPNK